MANISSAHGTLTLQGPWSGEDIALFVPVLDTWQFYGEYGIQSYDTKLSVRHMTGCRTPRRTARCPAPEMCIRDRWWTAAAAIPPAISACAITTIRRSTIS